MKNQKCSTFTKLNNWFVFLLFATCLSCLNAGCAEPLIVRVYEKPVKPLSEVAVLTSPYFSGVNVEFIDNQKQPQNETRYYFSRALSEYHLLPGKHTIIASYAGKPFYHSDKDSLVHLRSLDYITLEYDFQKRHVYELIAVTYPLLSKTDNSYLIGRPLELLIFDWGIVKNTPGNYPREWPYSNDKQMIRQRQELDDKIKQLEKKRIEAQKTTPTKIIKINKESDFMCGNENCSIFTRYIDSF